MIVVVAVWLTVLLIGISKQIKEVFIRQEYIIDKVKQIQEKQYKEQNK